MTLQNDAILAPSLNGRNFVMEWSSNSAVNLESPSTFRYFERDGVVWGDYDGDTVTFGRFVGTRVGNDLSVSFAHVLTTDGTVITGTGNDVVEAQPDGTVKLLETFVLDGVDHTSVCVEI